MWRYAASAIAEEIEIAPSAHAATLIAIMGARGLDVLIFEVQYTARFHTQGPGPFDAKILKNIIVSMPEILARARERAIRYILENPQVADAALVSALARGLAGHNRPERPHSALV